MLIKFDDSRVYDVRFIYKKTLYGTVDTTCEISKVLFDSIENKFSYEYICSGLALQSKKDAHVKKIARKVSLGNALHYFGKEDRTIIWKQYLEKVK